LYIKRVLMVLEDFLFFSLYSFSCIASNSTTLKDILILVLSIRTSSSVPQHPYHLRPTPPVTLHATCHTPHATRRPPPTKHCLPYTPSLTPPGAWRLQLSKSLDRACRSIHGSIQSSEIRSVPSSAIGRVLESDWEVYLGVF